MLRSDVPARQLSFWPRSIPQDILRATALLALVYAFPDVALHAGSNVLVAELGLDGMCRDPKVTSDSGLPRFAFALTTIQLDWIPLKRRSPLIPGDYSPSSD